jgi:hypothetical protein
MSCNNCGNQNGNMIPVIPVTPNTQKDVVLIGAPMVKIENLSDAGAYRFRFSTYAYTSLTATLGLTAKAAGVTKTSPVLKGTILDYIQLTMAYNKAIAFQTLSNTGGLTPPSLLLSDILYEYDAVAVVNNITFTLTGNDGEGQSGSVASDSKSITFGNVMYLGKGPSKTGTLASGMEAFIESLATSTIKTSRGHTYYATGVANEHHFVAYPKAWGESVFTKGIFTGGYVRLRNVGGTMEIEGTPEIDISFGNSASFSENYYIYQSLYDNQNDPVTPFIIT